MSYQVLARKWRPKKFEELMGQEHVVTVLVNALAQQRLHHAYLFTGTRGVGKTSIARIFAKSLNCETGITATPCGQCDTCLEIDQGRFVDLLEIDAASKTKVDDTREILDNVQYAPTRGRYKVYLIDEVHMLSRHSFNALLKTLEEPPEHVKFILATTDPQKLPVTVLSRCLQFHLKALTVKQIEAKLEDILTQEQVAHEAGALTLLAKAARGSMRDSLSLTDQAIAQGQGNIVLANVVQMLGGINQNWIYKIVIALLKQDGEDLMAITADIASCAPSYNRLFAELIQLFHQVAILQMVEQHFDLSPEHAQLLKKFSQAMSPEDVQLYYQICVNGRKDLPYAADEQAAFDMTLLRLFAFKPMQKVDTSIEQQAVTNVAVDFDNVELTEPEASENITDDFVEPSQVNQNKQIPEPEQTVDVQPESIEPLDLESEAQQTEPEVQLAQELLAIEQEAAQLHEPMQELTDEKPSTSVEGALIAEQASEQQTQVETSSEQNVQDSTLFDSPVGAVLAGRNMLRSRKKQLEQQAKKPRDVTGRHATAQEFDSNAEKTASEKQESNSVELPAPEQPYQAERIDPAIIKKANQVDQWAHMIDSMELTARLRQLAIHATIDESSTDQHLILSLDQATRHLYTEVAQQQLQQTISQYLSQDIRVTINLVAETVADPFQIQSHINDKRYDYAKEVLEKDEIVQALQQNFQANLDEETITAI
ncbi:MAG: DNA polymerase III subunit gamma/tau [Colwellia sp.]|nr:DNA polymerase III subunit gamma/tau [Colwellia sp.]MCW8866035.1 DNA polymerase III subunit gamma/tau [Colwellia sp.]MCW9081634.1 DNA polymerase III subunit gamma/tau [Colwellia sp.]